MLIPDGEGHYSYGDQAVKEYWAFVDSHMRIIEIFTTEDAERIVIKNEWEDLNDIEKYVVMSRGWDIPGEKEKLKKGEKSIFSAHEAEIIPFPKSS